VLAALRLLVDWPSHAGEVAASSTALVPIALAAGTSPRIARGADRILVHTVSATGLTAVVVAVYLVVVIGLGRSPADEERTLLVLSMAAAAIAALAYVPARERLAETANRLVYGERHPPDEVLRTWGTRLSRAIPMDELLLQLAESLRKVLAPRRAEIWTGSGGNLELTVAVPDRTAPPLALSAEEQPVVTRAGVTGNAWVEVWLPALLEGREGTPLRVAPASHGGELLGLLVLERDPAGDDFSEDDDRVLAELARQVGLALHNVQLDSALQASLEDLERANEDLRASRARIVATGDAERRRIERNLHDGAQQHLVALAVNLRLARDILEEDPAGAAEMLEALAGAVQETIQELRDLAHGIYPPLLMDAGLAEALRAAANRSPLSVVVEADGIGRYPSEVEAAVYFCCLEALQNAAKHAPAASVRVGVCEHEGQLRFEVVDDGPGFDATVATAGHGYVNMSDRVGAIGGSVDWRSTPGAGAAVLGAIPVQEG
jgi:signal transduction histidine kinase